MSILVDSSIWVDYFKSGENSVKLDGLLENDKIVINDIILAELEPFLVQKKQYKIIELLHAIKKLPLQIYWPGLIRWQADCLTSGINGIGIPDLIIAQNAKQQDCEIYSLDKHYRLLNNVVKELKLFS
ncbi:MAG: PIN domain-containing protein [Methylococcales bacterium]|nr:PIN domain-containing protein [Methylococcales bacterium]